MWVGGGRVVSHTPNNFWTPAGFSRIQLNSDIKCPHHLPGDSNRCHRLRIQCHKTATQVPTSDLSCKARLLCVLLTDQLQMEDSYNPSLGLISLLDGEGNGTPLQYSCLENPMDGGAWWAAVHGFAKSRTRLSDFAFTFHFPALEKAMATHSSVLAWRISGTGEPHGLPSMGSHRVGHD